MGGWGGKKVREYKMCVDILYKFCQGNKILLQEEWDEILLKMSIGRHGPPLWSSGQSFWLQIQRSRVRSPALPDFSE